MFSKGFSVIDVRDPRNPKPVKYVPAPRNTWTIHLQTYGDLLLVINAMDMFAAEEFQDERAYYIGSHAEKAEARLRRREKTRLVGRPCRLRYFKTGRAAPDRLHAGGRRRHSPHLVHRRTLGLRVGDARRLYRLHLHDHRYGRSGEAERSRALLAAGHEHGCRRNADLGVEPALRICIMPSSMATPRTARGATAGSS